MRTKRNWFVIAITVIMAGSLTSCLDEGQNSQDFPAVPAYMTQKDMKYYMETIYGNAYAAGLSNIVSDPFELYDTYGIAWYNINYDEQPAGTDGITVPYTAGVSGWLPVKTTSLDINGGEFSDYYMDTIISANLFYGQLLRNHAFFVMRENAPSSRVYNYHLTLNTDSTASQGGVPALYMQAEMTSPGSGTSSAVDFAYAFDMSTLMNDSRYVEDVKITGIDCQQVKFNLYYQSGVNKTSGKPVFTKANTEGTVAIVRVKPKN